MPRLVATLSRSLIPAGVGVGLVLASVAFLSGQADLAHLILLITVSLGSVPLMIEIIQSMVSGRFGVDLIAIVAIGSSIALGEYLAGTVVLLMLSGGEALEEFALKRARRDLTDLVSRSPQKAHKLEHGNLREVPVETILPGDTVIVKPGETVPVDGTVTEGTAMADESALTGEALPVGKWPGAYVLSGSIVTDSPLTIRAVRVSSESKYQQIIRLVEAAEKNKAPFVRLADRYSVGFTILTFVMAAAAWFLSHDPVRLLAVLVVATPCPLILATPIAFAAGISRAAKRGIIVRSGGALEHLGQARSFVFDKTGTLTLGTPSIQHVEGYGIDEQNVIKIAASIDQLSAHVLGKSLVQYARQHSVLLARPTDFTEQFGQGVRGSIDGQVYLVGRLTFLQAAGVTVTGADHTKHDALRANGQMVVYVANTERLLGAIILTDTVRPNVRELFASLRTLGIQTVRMLTGDKRAVALRIASEIGLKPEDVRAECLPEDKVKEVERLKRTDGPTVMVGDGINDAPALVAADVGIAMGVGGQSASSEAGDIVILVDQIERVGEALALGHRVLTVALQSIIVGIGLSAALMVLAALGYVPPVAGALSQEVIDVVVILNALRVLF